MGDVIQFVDSLSGGAAVLLDLNNDSPFSTSLWSAPPPPLRQASSATLIDGDIVSSSSHGDRTINLRIDLFTSTQDLNATSLQTLARILDRDAAWLKYQPTGMTAPVFFRTKRASIATIEEVIAATAMRYVEISIPAGPYAEGLPETDTFTITNNPTSGTNKMMYAFGTIKGDVPAPLVMTFPTPDGEHKTLVASCADYGSAAISAPFYKSLSADTINASPAVGWTVADTADATMVAGTRRRLTKASGTLLVRPTSAVMLQWASLPPGDYRVMVRTSAAPAGAELLFFNRPPSTGSELIYSEAVGKATVAATTTGKDWHDLGVVAMPGGAPVTDIAYGLAGATGPALWNLAVNLTTATGTLDLDAIVLIPVGRPNTITKLGSVMFPANYTSRAVTWDGLTYRRFASGESTFTAGVASPCSSSEVTGGNPVVAPGASNVLHFFTTTANSAVASRVSDDKAATTAITVTYRPRYYYVRPATT